MDENKLRELNNQTNNVANEKWRPGAKGNTTDGPPDHTYPEGAVQQQGKQYAEDMRVQQSGMGSGDMSAGASMQTQPSGGTGPTQGITDSHQRQMEERSGAYGQLEQPVGDRPADQGVSVGNRQGRTTPATNTMNPQNPMQPELQGGALGSRHGNAQSSTQGGGQRGPLADMPVRQGGSMGGEQSAVPQDTQGGGQRGRQADTPAVQRAGSMSAQQGIDRNGSQAGASEQRETEGVHESNDLAGGLPRSPGGSGPWPDKRDTHLTGAQNAADMHRADDGVHESNDVGGGLPRSPGGANKLAADEKMDDDTGFSNRGR